MLSWEYPPRLVGGISRHVQELSRAIVRRNVDVHVITAPHPGAPAFEVDEGVNIHRVDVDLDTTDFAAWVHRLNTAMETCVDRLIQLNKPIRERTLIHAHDWLTAFSAKALKLKYKLPMVATIHATEFGRNYGLHSDLNHYISGVEWELAFEAWEVICCSYYMRDEIHNCFSTPYEKIRVIPNGIDAAKFRHKFDKPAFRARYAADNEKIIFFVGRMVREKGASVLIDAFTRVLSQYNDTKLIIAGGGHRDHLVSQAEGHGIADRIYFTGYIDDETLIRLYLTADLAVFPSLYEPFGIVALEAMAARVPVVVSDIGGLREVVSHGVCGISTWANNPDSLAWGILQILNNPEAAKRMANTGYRKATTEYSWDRIAKTTDDCYRGVLEAMAKSGWVSENTEQETMSGMKKNQ